jgi:hypothetical protein
MARFGKPGVAMLSTAIFLFPAFSAKGQEVRRDGPPQMRVELDNPSLSVLRVVLGPHEKTGMHDVSARLIVWLTEAHLRDAMADGSTREYERAAGTVEWIPEQRHAGENLADKPIEFLAVLPKAGALTPMPTDHSHH